MPKTLAAASDQTMVTEYDPKCMMEEEEEEDGEEEE